METGKVIPLLLGLDVASLTGPLAQFQAKKCDEQGLRETLLSVNTACPEAVEDSKLQRLFNSLWKEFSEDISKLPKSPQLVQTKRSIDDILEEVVTLNRSIDQKIDRMRTTTPRNLYTSFSANALSGAAGVATPSFGMRTMRYLNDIRTVLQLNAPQLADELVLHLLDALSAPENPHHTPRFKVRAFGELVLSTAIRSQIDLPMQFYEDLEEIAGSFFRALAEEKANGMRFGRAGGVVPERSPGVDDPS